MLVPLLNDLHLCGARSDSEVVARHQRKFFENIFFPYCKEHSIDTVFVLGDLLEHRTKVNLKSLQESREVFFAPMQALDIDLHVLAGNHDVYHKNTNNLSGVSVLFGEYQNLMFYKSSVSEISLGGCLIGVVPWMTEDNTAECLAFLKKTKAKIIFGHFDLMGFDMQPGYPSRIGLDLKIFSKFDMVLSGHYHCKSQQKNVIMLGSQYEFDWSDEQKGFGAKGFHVFDTVKKTIEFVPNPCKLHQEIVYLNGQVDYEPPTDQIVRIVVKEKPSQKHFDKFINIIKDEKPYKLDIIDLTLAKNLDVAAISDEALKQAKVTDLIDSYVSLTTIPDALKPKVTDYLKELHWNVTQ